MTQNTSTAAPVRARVIEWAPFRLKDGVTKAELLRASDALQREFLDQQPGFVRRELLEGKDGAWVDLVYWADDESAQAIMTTVAESPVCNRYFALMQGADQADPAAGVSHFAVVRPYTSPADGA